MAADVLGISNHVIVLVKTEITPHLIYITPSHVNEEIPQRSTAAQLNIT